MNVAVLGTGSWGTALTLLLARNGHQVTLIGRSEDEEVTMLNNRRENLRYLPGFILPADVAFGLIEDEHPEFDMTVVAVPANAVRGVMRTAKMKHRCVVVAAKGLEGGTGKLMSEVVTESVPDAEVGVISGPNLAVEIARGIPTAAVSAFADLSTADRVRSVFMCRSFRVYVSSDVRATELAGALKNVLAIGAGMSDGLGFGDNTKGALLARGLHEMMVLGMAMGSEIDAFMGVAGVGDLFATASSKLSRNYRVGLALGQGMRLADVLAEIGQVAEGVPTSEGAMMLARRFGVQAPVFEAIEGVIRGRLRPVDAVTVLMERSPRTEGILFSR
jgi:glycerol-3-phosphate dehydrogenase (NAD(P)+)